MTVLELMHKSQDKLQDTDANYWTQSELLDYYNSGLRALAAERKEKPTNTTVTLLDDTYEYQIDGVLRYISAEDNDGVDRPLYQDDGTGDNDLNGIIIQDYNRIYVNTPATDDSIVIKHIAMPVEHNLGTTVRSGDETALKYYILSQAYEKESDMENFQKSQYFMGKYDTEMKILTKNSKLNYVTKVETTIGYQF